VLLFKLNMQPNVHFALGL